MRSMATEPTRRTVLGLLAGSFLLPSAAFGNPARPLYLSACAMKTGFGVGAFDDAGEIRYSFALPGRGHGFACRHNGDLAVAFSRRPGLWMVVFDPRTGQLVKSLEAAEGRNFCGHGAFSPDGRRLFATEVIADTGEGVLGVYAADAGFRRIDEWPTEGLDPHEVLLLPDGRHLAVANGGILMRSDLPRMKLNLTEMDPSVGYVDIRTGRVARLIRPPAELRQLSIRHMAVGRKGEVLIGMQYEGPESDEVPLVAMHEGPGSEAPLHFLSIPAEQQGALSQYCGSVATDRSGRYLAVTSPRGSTVLICDLENGTVNAMRNATDVCGATRSVTGNGFILSSGTGRLTRWSGAPATLSSRTDLRWDNHIYPAAV